MYTWFGHNFSFKYLCTANWFWIRLAWWWNLSISLLNSCLKSLFRWLLLQFHLTNYFFFTWLWLTTYGKLFPCFIFASISLYVLVQCITISFTLVFNENIRMYEYIFILFNIFSFNVMFWCCVHKHERLLTKFTNT